MNEPVTSWPFGRRHLLHQRLAGALGDAAMGLAVQDQRVHRAADIVDRGVAVDPHHAGLGIDLDLADMPAVGIGADPAVDVTGIGDRPVCRRELDQPDAAVGARHREAAVGEGDIGLAGLELLGRELCALGDDALRRPCGSSCPPAASSGPNAIRRRRSPDRCRWSR